ncbi:protease SohB [Candidatus Synchoanobacter obligatus]|uniref:Protease SohB n=1 Tax=Candidatus Synchoanobacter obligatus TaxID=2919597 RepID=A0ABT1L5Z5_9GAMM|nr:protease SohB [Candidatus Synchoanobacter obligatus]MCP8352585.1 protease SohB [Candidatus Synchoanobacter obligatus]
MLLLDQYLLFLAKGLTVLFFILLIIKASTKKARSHKPSITHYNKEALEDQASTCKELKSFKHFKSVLKKIKKSTKALSKPSEHLFVLDFDGDIKASQVSVLRQEINLILSIANENDQVLIRLNSRGGTVTGYGLAASQIHRIRKAGLHLTIAIDEMAASGGYLIASLANQIIAAPFACIGSIGVAYELPNIYQLLAKHGIEYKQITAGKYKRTLSVFGEPTEEGENKVKEDAELTHKLFKEHITQYRDLNLDEVATGETWPATVAHEKGLVDQLYTSDEYIQDHLTSHAIFIISTPTEESLLKTLKAKAIQALQALG